jgi:hypothetical protein
MFLGVLVLQSSQDIKLGRVERSRDAVVHGRGAAFDVKPLESAWSAKHEQVSGPMVAAASAAARRWPWRLRVPKADSARR